MLPSAAHSHVLLQESLLSILVQGYSVPSHLCCSFLSSYTQSSHAELTDSSNFLNVITKLFHISCKNVKSFRKMKLNKTIYNLTV